jgi:PDZ domain
MKNSLRIALAVLFLLSMATAQNIPAIDVFGGYSFLGFNMPSSVDTTAQRLSLQGWDGSAAVGLFQHLAVEADFSGHQLSDCGGTTGLNCSNLSFMFGPRYNLGDRATKKITGFVHALVGEDRATLPLSGIATTDTSVGLAAGGAVDYWVGRHIGVQLGPADYFYTHHLNVDGVSSQNNYRAAAGIVFRFGGELPAPAQTTTAPAPAPQPRSRRGRGQSQPASTEASEPAGVVNVPGRGMSIIALGAVVGPQEFDGAKIVQIVPGGVAEMSSLKAGDLIKSVDGKAVRTPMELAAELSDKAGKVTIGIQRGDFATDVVLLLGRH